MTTRITTTYRKPGAAFASATDANNDKNSRYSAELMAATKLWLENRLAEGILLAPTKLTWDPETSVLSLEREVSDIDFFNQDRPFTNAQAVTLAEQAGWDFQSTEIVEI